MISKIPFLSFYFVLIFLFGVGTDHVAYANVDAFNWQISIPTFNQQNPPEKQKEEPKSSEEELSLSDIIRRSTTDYIYIDHIGQRLLSPETIKLYENKTKKASEDVKRYLKESRRRENLEELNQRGLENLLRQWQNRKSNLDRLSKELAIAIDDLDKEKNKITNILEFWSKYESEHPDNNNKKLLHSKIREINKKGTQITPGFDDQIERLLILLDKVSETLILADEEMVKIQKTLKGKTYDILSPSAGFFWKDIPKLRPELFAHDLAVFWERTSTDFTSVIKDYKTNHFVILLILILLIFLTYLIKKNLHHFEKYSDPYIPNIIRIFDTPLITSFYLTYVFANFVYYSTPNIFIEVLSISFVLFFVLMMNKLLSPQIVKLVHIFVVMWLLVKVIEFLSYLGLTGRLIMLITQILFLTLLIAAFYRYSKNNFSNFPSHTREWIKVYLKLSIALVVIAFLADFFGYLGLSYNLFASYIKFSLLSLIILVWYSAFKCILHFLFYGDLGFKIKIIYQNRDHLFLFFKKAVFWISIAFMITFLLRGLSLNTVVYDTVIEFMNDPIQIGSFSFTPWNVLLFFLIIWLSNLTASIIRSLLRDDLLVRAKLDRGLPETISMLVRYAIIVAGFFLAVSAIGMEFSKLAIIFGAFSVGIGFGLQNIFNNLVSGLILIFERPINIEDTIEVNQIIGNVKRIGIRSSHIRTFDGAEVVIPNGHLISNEVTNWTLSDQQRRIEVIVGVAYGTDVNKVKTILLEVLKNNEEISKYPEPLVLFQAFGDSSLNFRLLFWTDNFHEWVIIRSQVLFAINDAFAQNSIEIPFPQRDLHIRSDYRDKGEKK